MNSQYFGFEDEEIPEVIDTITRTPCSTTVKTPIAARVGSKSNVIPLPISQIHQLLRTDSAVDVEESTLDTSVTVNESSFYADDDTSICQPSLDSTAEESFSIQDSSSSNIVVNGKARKIIKAERKRKILASLDANSEKQNPSTASTPVPNYKKRVPRSATKNKENQPPKRIKTAKRNIPDENYDELADQLNKRFQEIEDFKLIVE